MGPRKKPEGDRRRAPVPGEDLQNSTTEVMKLQPYWLDSAPAFAAGAEEPLPAKCDVAIVGGGFTGLSAALAFARQGIDVVVLEAGSVAAAASGRNGGHCNNGLAHDFTATAARLGLEKASALYRAYDSAVDTVESVAREESIDCDFRRSGKIQLASKPRHFERLQKTHEILSHGIDTQTRLIPRAEIGREVKSTSFHGGLLYERSASLHGRRAHRRSRSRCMRAHRCGLQPR